VVLLGMMGAGAGARGQCSRGLVRAWAWAWAAGVHHVPPHAPLQQQHVMWFMHVRSKRHHNP